MVHKNSGVQDSQDKEQFPLITICTLTLNREWIISKTIESIFSQGYPMDRIRYVIIDGGSSDNTVHFAENMLKKLVVKNYKIKHSMNSSIPHDRNICISDFEGSILVYWDSDVIAPPNTLQQIVKVVCQGWADIVSPKFCDINFNTVNEAKDFADKIVNQGKNDNLEVKIRYVNGFTGMGLTAVHRKVFDKGINFDKDLTFSEDRDFCRKALEAGFRIAILEGTKAYDINVKKQPFSSIYIDMPFMLQLKGLRKKAKLMLYSEELGYNLKNAVKILSTLATTWLYILSLILTLIGLFCSNILLIPTFGIHIFLYFSGAVYRRGVKRGLRLLLKLIIIDLPFSIACAYYILKLLMNKHLT